MRKIVKVGIVLLFVALVVLTILSFTAFDSVNAGIGLACGTVVAGVAIFASGEGNTQGTRLMSKLRRRMKRKFHMFGLLNRYINRIKHKKGGVPHISATKVETLKQLEQIFKEIDSDNPDVQVKEVEQFDINDISEYDDGNGKHLVRRVRDEQGTHLHRLSEDEIQKYHEYLNKDDSLLSEENKIDDLQKYTTPQNGDSKSNPLTHDDRQLLKNLALIRYYPFDKDNCRDAIYKPNQQELSGEALQKEIAKWKDSLALSIQNMKRRQFETDLIQKGVSPNEANQQANAKVVEYMETNPPSLIHILAYLKSMQDDQLNPDERNFIVNRSLIEAHGLTYNIYNCNKNIISHILNDFDNANYLKMFSQHKDLEQLKLLYSLSNNLETYNPLEGKVENYMSDVDTSLVNELKVRAKNNKHDIKIVPSELSGITKLKLSHFSKMLRSLAEADDLNRGVYKQLIDTSKTFNAVLDQIRSATDSLYSSNNYNQKQFENTELVIDGADVVNALINVDKKCPSHTINMLQMSNNWCGNNKIKVALHPDKNRGCIQSATEKMQIFNNRCQSLNRGSQETSNVRVGSEETSIVRVDSSKVIDVNQQKLNDIVYFNKISDTTFNDSFKRFLYGINLQGDDKIDEHYISKPMLRLLSHVEHNGAIKRIQNKNEESAISSE